MSEILFQYEPVKPTTWAYLASLLVIALYFKFNRVLSVRNWDLVRADPAGAGAAHGAVWRRSATKATMPPHLVEHVGYIWLFAVSGLFMLRLLLDAFMVRRPLLEPNLTVGGLTFLGLSLFVFLMANVVTGNAGRGRRGRARSGRRSFATDGRRRKKLSHADERTGPVSR